jgi:hypothetical protein
MFIEEKGMNIGGMGFNAYFRWLNHNFRCSSLSSVGQIIMSVGQVKSPFFEWFNHPFPPN